MLLSLSNICRCSPALMFAFGLPLILLLSDGYSEASLYHIKGLCSYKGRHYKAGESFRRGCDKCFCHDFGSYCLTPMKPTSWPRKCRRIRTECGYTVVYKEEPLAECRAYSWIG
ncbi:uncharacterized protein AB9W97_017864 isoform 1-T1 [Spinachia spinachia]